MPQQREVPEGSVIISPQDVYTEVKLLTDQVRQLVAKDANDPLPHQVERHERESKERHDKLAERVTALEKRVWMWSGAAATIGATVGSLIAPRLGG